jgi:hypothetical protein
VSEASYRLISRDGSLGFVFDLYFSLSSSMKGVVVQLTCGFFLETTPRIAKRILLGTGTKGDGRCTRVLGRARENRASAKARYRSRLAAGGGKLFSSSMLVQDCSYDHCYFFFFFQAYIWVSRDAIMMKGASSRNLEFQLPSQLADTRRGLLLLFLS